MKRIIMLACALVAAISAHSQYIINTTALRLLNGSEAIAGTIPGTIYYNPTTNKFMFREGSTWVMLGSGGGSGITDGDKGDVSVSGLGANWLIDNGAVTFAKMQTIGTNTLLGRISASTGLVEQLTPAQVNTMLPFFTRTLRGSVPPSGGTTGTANFLREDGAWAVPPGTGGAGSGTTETASNGLYKSGNDIRQGGNVYEATTLSITGVGKYRITSTGVGFGIGSEFFYGGFHMASGDYTARSGQYADLWVDGSGIQMRAKATTGNETGISISTVAGDMTVIDNRTTKKGLMTGQPGMVTDPRSYADKQYVDQMIASVSNVQYFTSTTGGIVAPSGSSPSTKILYGDNVWRTAPTAGTTYSVFTRSVNGLVPAPGGSTTTRALYEDGTWKTVPTYALATSTTSGLVPPSGGGTGKYLDADFVWKFLPSGGGGSGTVTTDAGQVAYGVGTDAVGGEAAYTYNSTSNQLAVDNIKLNVAPTNNAASTQMLTRNTSTGNIESMIVGSGTYTPTLTTKDQSISSVTFSPAHYIRIGNEVSVNGSVTVIHGYGVSSESWIQFTEPIASAFTLQSDVAGFAAWSQPIDNAYHETVTITANQTEDSIRIYFWGNPSNETEYDRVWTYQYKYTIK